MRFARETMAQVYPDMLALLEEHWRALARNQDAVPLLVDQEFYRRAEAAGGLMAATARTDAGALAGYAVYFLRFHPHYVTTRWAASDVFWVTPGARGAGVGMRLFLFVEAELRREGARVMNTSYKLAHPQAGRLLDYLGHEPIEAVHQKVLL
jgi:GNAT superfamily N-acetyltransferase